MANQVVTDAQIAEMTAAERRELINRLKRPRDDFATHFDPRLIEGLRQARVGVMAAGAVGLIPWIVYLALTLPSDYVAQNWPVTWVGFDFLLIAFMAMTAVFGWLRRQLVLLTAFTTAILLVCDAWFDIMTASPGDQWISILSAVLAELPLAAFMIVRTLRIMRVMATQLWLIEPGMPLWRLPLLP
ncbi:hypothetical protein [Smaragdicoccus niigatensis]|uniref:hypothetical protein n=1 Tax=Smaragdicoccus niigatensis TaxID=359359 RepID=UPI000362F841|nr:hypothetical protein [Smaragdicoccus niigatensis]